MSRYKSLDSQTGKHFVVIRKNRSYPLHVIKDFLDSNYSKYALIVHKEDKDPITGITIPIHYHYVGIHINRQIRLSTLLNDIRKTLKEEDNNGIEVDSYRSLELSLQYLIHKNNPEKTQHDVGEIIFNGWTKEELVTYLTADSTGINFDRVFQVCKDNSSKVDVIRELGFHNYARYRSTILDIFEELHPHSVTALMKDPQMAK